MQSNSRQQTSKQHAVANLMNNFSRRTKKTHGHDITTCWSMENARRSSSDARGESDADAGSLNVWVCSSSTSCCNKSRNCSDVSVVQHVDTVAISIKMRCCCCTCTFNFQVNEDHKQAVSQCSLLNPVRVVVVRS